jgi:hypothetical protein
MMAGEKGASQKRFIVLNPFHHQEADRAVGSLHVPGERDPATRVCGQ